MPWRIEWAGVPDAVVKNVSVCRPGQRMANTTTVGRFRTSHWLTTAANRSGVQREVWNLPLSVTFFVAVAHVKTTAVFSFCLSSEPLGFGRPVDSKVIHVAWLQLRHYRIINFVKCSMIEQANKPCCVMRVFHNLQKRK